MIFILSNGKLHVRLNSFVDFQRQAFRAITEVLKCPNYCWNSEGRGSVVSLVGMGERKKKKMGSERLGYARMKGYVSTGFCLSFQLLAMWAPWIVRSEKTAEHRCEKSWDNPGEARKEWM